MKTDSSVKVLLLLILLALIYLCYVVTGISKTMYKINNTMDSTTTDGSTSKPTTPKAFKVVQGTTDTSTSKPTTPKVNGRIMHTDSTTSDTTSGGSGDPKKIRN